MPERIARLGAVALLGASLLLGAGPAGATVGPVKVPDQQRFAAGAETHSVTLLTGDRVRMHSADGSKAVVIPGKGREHIKFSTRRTRDNLYVIPADAMALVRTGRLDRRLFDVRALVRAGYDDKRTKTLPLLVKYASPTQRSAPALAADGVTTTRALPSIGGASVRVAKDEAVTAWPQLRQARGVERYWLNGKRRVLLSESVPQIGAPKAWEAGFDGEGVTVAVIDTGVDATHPDLAGKVTAAKDFTGEGPADGFGHGTHVASTIAGTAEGSKGKYKGVAPKAKLVSAKVCDSDGWCTDEAILGGLEWSAVTQKAKIANLSLGGTDTPEIDPLEQAVNDLTAKTGTLFVIAAGNEGPGAETVSSPGSAEAALTVGAVDKKDGLADFSSRGPRVGDSAIKPDVTAPGVDIAAARAKGTELGDPVEDFPDSYVIASGTSMATPHTAGAAAILAQQHPDWKAAQIKSVLMASASAHPDQSVFEQGAGRIDVAAAIGQTLVADPGSVSFGKQLWPHNDDKPITKQVTYRNHGKEAVTLEVSASMTGPDGKPAPAGAVKVGTPSVTIPAGGEGKVAVTVDTKHDGKDGVYSGRIVASNDDATVTAPIAVEKEIESYDVTIDHIGPDGKPSTDGEGLFYGIDEDRWVWVYGGSEPSAKIRLPKGKYLYAGDIVIDRGGKTDFHRTVWPELTVDRAQTLKVDATKTKPLKVTVPKASARPNLVDIGFTRIAHLSEGYSSLDATILSNTLDGIFTAAAGADAPAADMSARVNTQWGEPGEKGDFADSPYLYLLMWFEPGRFFNGFSKTVEDAELAQVRSEHGIQVTKGLGTSLVFGSSDAGFTGWSTYWSHQLPTKVTQFHTTENVSWSKDVAETAVVDGWDEDQVLLTQPYRKLRAGKTYRDRWNSGVFGPAFPKRSYGPWAGRAGDEIVVDIPAYSDGSGHAGFSRADKARTQLFRAGKKIAESDYPASLEPVEVPAGPATFKLVTSATRAKIADVSTKLQATWTFRSAHAGEPKKPAALPLWAARFQPKVDARTLSHQGPTHLVPVTFEAQKGAPVGQLTKVSVDVSVDDGKTWTKGTLLPAGINTWTLLVSVPQATDYVSLRAKASDNKGNTLEQTITRAYGIAP